MMLLATCRVGCEADRMVIRDSMHDSNQLVVRDGEFIVKALLESPRNGRSDLVWNVPRVVLPGNSACSQKKRPFTVKENELYQ